MKRLNCNLIVRETQSASAKVLEDLKEDENKDFNIEEIFKDKALKKDEKEDSSRITKNSPADNTQDSEVEKTKA